jgi:hypothetical protein
MFSHDFTATAQPEIFCSKSTKQHLSLLPVGIIGTSINCCSLCLILSELMAVLTRNRRLYSLIFCSFLSKKLQKITPFFFFCFLVFFVYNPLFFCLNNMIQSEKCYW